VDRQGRPTTADEKPQTEERHPEEWRRDLNPDHLAGQNIGRDDAAAEQGLRTAYDVKPLHRALHDLPDDELKQIPVLPTGARLQQGATYLDLADPARREITATGQMLAEAGHCLVPKDRVPYETWNRLTGEDGTRRAQGRGKSSGKGGTA
jgi:hypothetical protein